LERVVITGLGLVSCLGHSPTEVAASLRAGRSGIVRDPERAEVGFRSPLTGAIQGFDAKAYLKRKERRSMGEPALYAAVAALRAVEDAQLDRDALRRPDAGVILGNDSTAGSVTSMVDRTRADGTTRNLGSSAIVEVMNSTATMNLSVLLGTQGASWTISAACSSGAHSIGQGYGLIATGQQDVMVVGGTQEINWPTMAAFDALSAFSTHDGDPGDAVRPFSRDRDGLVPSGGSAVLILESLSHAQARGARVRAEVLSYAFSSDGYHVTAPSGEGAVRCVRKALALARTLPEEVEYVNAHAAGTAVGDATEAAAMLDVFGPKGPPISSTKSLTGHECWMAGASEVAYTLLMAEGGFLAPNRNFTGHDDGAEALDIIRETRDVQARRLVSNSFGFGGTNACLVLDGDFRG
jgi:3-oxoacyl-[acyl-carrier-protein] synthase I